VWLFFSGIPRSLSWGIPRFGMIGCSVQEHLQHWMCFDDDLNPKFEATLLWITMPDNPE